MEKLQDNCYPYHHITQGTVGTLKFSTKSGLTADPRYGLIYTLKPFLWSAAPRNVGNFCIHHRQSWSLEDQLKTSKQIFEQDRDL